jgi:uncharacterized protein (TIGR02001 family)
MKKTLTLLATLAAAAAPSLASAQAAAPAASPLTGNFTLTSDYRFRGLSQSFKLPAVQGGIDWAHESGFYLGNWNSSVSGNQYPNGASLEMDFYGGYKFPVGKDVVVDVGGLYFYYPGAFFNGFSPDKPKFDHFELYVGATMGPLSGKVFYGLTDFFGLDDTVGGRDSKGATYLDLNYSTEIFPKTTLGLHVGYQYVPNYDDFDYWDYKIGLTYDWTGWLLSAAIVGTTAEKSIYFATDGSGKIKNIGETGLVLSITKTF